MARPKTDDGFVMVAIDLFAAMMAAGLSGYAQVVLAEVLMQTYGPKKREYVHLWATEIGDLTGLEKHNAWRAIKELETAGIIARVPTGRDHYRFVKDYESWTPKGGRLADRLKGGLLAWVREAIGRLGTPKTHRRTSDHLESGQTTDHPESESTQTTGVESTQTTEIEKRESTQTTEIEKRESTQTTDSAGPLKERAPVRVLGSLLTLEGARNQRREEEKSREEEIPPMDPPKGDSAKKPRPAFPVWWPSEDWGAFVEMRRRIKKPMTDTAVKLAISKLDALRRAGQDPAAVLQQSIFHAWQGLFEVNTDFVQATKAHADEEPKYHVAPPDSPFRQIADERRAKLFALFGGQGGQAPTAEPGGGGVGPGVMPAG